MTYNEVRFVGVNGTAVFGVILVLIFPAFSRIRTEYGEIRSKMGKCGQNADQNNSEYGQFLRSVVCCAALTGVNMILQSI